MIKNITIRSVASYPREAAVTIDTDKRVNLLYGHNGTGKSTIASFLQRPDDPKFKACSIGWAGEASEILVYNQEFISENFYNKPNQPGVFTLSKKNAEAESAIEAAEKELTELEKLRDALTEEGKAIKNAQDRELSALRDKVWEAKNKYERTPLEFCLDGYKGSKEKLYAKLLATADADGEVSGSELENEARELTSHSEVEKNVIGPVTFNMADVERAPILSEIIVGSSESYLSALIQRLGNSDWVKQGQKHMAASKSLCPFCQQKVPHDFTQAVGRLFDQTYEERVTVLQQLRETYRTAVTALRSHLDSSPFQDGYVTADAELAIAKTKLLDILDSNLLVLDKKVANPSLSVSVSESSAYVDELNDRIEVVGKRIRSFNDRIRNKKKHKDKIVASFWSMLRSQYGSAISLVEGRLANLEAQLKQKRANIEKIQTSIVATKSVISENRAKITNIELAIEAINSSIRLLGLSGFKLEKEESQPGFYRLTRDNDASNVYKTLSEGEKTLISFLYFLECCRGAASKDAAVNLGRRIIVIDDPISSLSHNYVYDVASLIHNRIIEAGFSQVFVLTHNLFFFHELLRLKNSAPECPAGYKLHRVSKSRFSAVQPMGRNEIQNDYQSYWNLLRDALVGKVTSVVIPNVMRNILEYYFNFVHQTEKLYKALADISTEHSDFKPLERYLNRGSHADAINLSEFGEIRADRYIEMFRLVFEKTGFGDHFDRMMQQQGEAA